MCDPGKHESGSELREIRADQDQVTTVAPTCGLNCRFLLLPEFIDYNTGSLVVRPCVVANKRNPARFWGNFITLAVEGPQFWGLARTVRRCVSRPPNQIRALRWLTRPFSAVFGRFPAIGHFGRKSPQICQNAMLLQRCCKNVFDAVTCWKWAVGVRIHVGGPWVAGGRGYGGV